jgi:hypothetical protein
MFGHVRAILRLADIIQDQQRHPQASSSNQHGEKSS